MSRDVTLLHPKLRKIVPALIYECKNYGLPVLMTDGFRTKAEQDKIYAQGRTTPGIIVSQVQYPNSAHNWGIAFDFCRNVRGKEYDDSDNFFARVAAIAKQYGLDWGGDWKNFVDKPHLQLREFMPNNSLASLRSVYGTPEKFIASWNGASAQENKGDDELRYRVLDDVPSWARKTIEKLMRDGIILGDGDSDLYTRVIDLSHDQVRILVWLDRKGLFDK